jgi:hypothetical protein
VRLVLGVDEAELGNQGDFRAETRCLLIRQVDEIFEEFDPNGLALLRVKLGCEHVVAPDG